MEPIITYQGKSWTYEQIRSGREEQLPSPLLFCRFWLRGDSTFSLHTSGSTGKPKTITVSRKQMEVSARMTGDFFDFSSGKPLFMALAPEYIAGKMLLTRAMEHNLSVHIIPPESTPFSSLTPGQQYLTTSLVPYQVHSMLDSGNYFPHFHQFEHILVGGAPIPEALEQRIRKQLSVPVWHTYGMTETLSHVAARLINTDQTRPYYQPLPGIDLRSEADHCLSIKGEVTQQTWLKTNDVVQLNNDQTFIWKGRKDNTINSGGIKVQAEEVEKIIQPLMSDILPEDAYFMITGVPHPQLGEEVVLVVSSPVDQQHLIAQLKHLLPQYHCPGSIIQLKPFPHTASGKIRRNDIKKRLLNNSK